MKTRKQIKHEMLLTFIDNARPGKIRRAAPPKPRLITTLLSFFL